MKDLPKTDQIGSNPFEGQDLPASHESARPVENQQNYLENKLSPSLVALSHTGGAPGSKTTPRISVSLDPNEYKRLYHLAKSNQRSLAWVIRYALKKLFDETHDRQFQLPLTWGTSSPWNQKSHDLEEEIERLKSVDWQNIRQRSSRSLNNLHPYPPRFSPEVPRILIETLTRPGDTVLDVFCGSAVTLVESLQLGRDAIGVDISPLAVLISRVKCTHLKEENQRAIQASADWARTLIHDFYSQTHLDCLRQGNPFNVVRNFWLGLGIPKAPAIPDSLTMSQLVNWFPLPALYELSLIRAVLEECPMEAAKNLGLMALSSIVILVSYQRNETRRSKVQRDIKPLETLRRWTMKVEEILDRLSSNRPPMGLCTAQVYQGDAKDLSFLKENSVDLLITSPPYPNVFDYRSHHRLRLMWLGLKSPMPANSEIGSHRAYSRPVKSLDGKDYEREMEAVFGSVRRVLNPSALCAFIIGPSHIHGKESDNEGHIITAANKWGFSHIASIGNGAFSTLGKLRHGRQSDGLTERIVLLRKA